MFGGRDFFEVVKGSFFDGAFYRDVREQRLEGAAKDFGLLALIGIGFLLLIFFFWTVIPFAFSNWAEKITSLYPADLVITYANGHVTTNQPQPYYVANTFDDSAASSSRKYIVVFDTDNKLSEDLAKESTYVLVKKTYLIADGNEERVIPFKAGATTTIDRATVNTIVGKVKPYVAPGIIIISLIGIVIGTLFGAFGWVLFHLIYILIPAVLIYLFARLRNMEYTYREAYYVTLYSSIPVALISYLVPSSFIPIPPFAYTALVVIFALINISKAGTVKEN